MRNIIGITILLVFAIVACGQTTYSIEAGVGGYLSSTPHSAADMNVVIGGQTNRISSFSTVEARPITTAAPTVAMRSGMQVTVASSGKCDLAAIVQAGGSYNQVGTSFSGATGGKLSCYPAFAKAPGLYFAGTVQALGDSTLGWNPQAAIWVGYQFSGVSAASGLKARRALAKLRK